MNIQDFWYSNCITNVTLFIENIISDGYYHPLDYVYIDYENGLEPMEYYIISDFLAEKLKSRGESIIEDFLSLPPIWCRTTSGQSVYMDAVIKDIWSFGRIR